MTETTVKPTIGILIIHGPEIRSFGYSGLINKLREKFNVVIWTQFPMSDVYNGMRKNATILDLPNDKVKSGNKLRAFFYQMHLNWYDREGEQKWAYAPMERKTKKKVSLRYLIKNLFSTNFFLRIFSFFELHLSIYFPQKIWVEEIRAKKIDILLCGNYFGPYVQNAIDAANFLKIKTFIAMHSWKDCYVHPRLPIKLTGFFSWSATESDHIRKWNPWIHYPIFDIGSLHIEAIQKCEIIPKNYFLEKFGLHQKEPYICYTMASKTAVPDEDQYIGSIAKLLKEKFPNIRLLVRLNPMNNQANFSFEKFTNVIVQRPLWEWNSKHNWCSPLEEDGIIWASTIFYSLCNISIPSTVTIEFLEFKKPVINFLISNSASTFSGNTLNRFWHAPFYRQLHNSKLVFPVYNWIELEKRIQLLTILKETSPNTPDHFLQTSEYIFNRLNQELTQ